VRPLRIGEGKKKKETTAAKYNGIPYWVAITSDEVTAPKIIV